MTTNIFIIHEDVFLLYKMIYNKNICSYYIRKCIIRTNILLYMKMYFYYTRRCIIKIFVVII